MKKGKIGYMKIPLSSGQKKSSDVPRNEIE